jgi:glycosyltransferase involved in cell wall biosynthesis
MRLLSVHNSADIYGASQSLLRMLSLFSNDGHEVHVVVPNSGPLLGLFEEHGVVVHILPFLGVIERPELNSFWGNVTFIVRYLRSIIWLSGLIVRLNVDVVHTNTAVVPAPAIAAWLTGRKHLWHIREFFAEFSTAWKYYQKYMWLFSTGIITISNAVRDQFEPRFRNKCITIYNGLGPEATDVDLAAARRFRSSVGDPEFLVGVVGRIKWVRKGQEVLIKAAALLADKYPKARYVIVGSPSPGNEDHLFRLRELIANENLEDRVIFTGDVQETRDIYAALDVTVVPSVLPEPFGRVVMESMAAGTPVIGSRCGGIPEQVEDGVTGLLFNPGDEEDLANALAQLLADKTKRLRMGGEGRKRFRNKFDESVAYAKLSRILRIAPAEQEHSIEGSSLVILSVHNSADIYGASRTLLRMLSPFSQGGHAVHVVLPDNGPLVDLLSEHGIVVHVFRSLAVIERAELGSVLGKMTFSLRCLYSIFWLSAQSVYLKADVVHTNTAVLPSPAVAAWLTGRKHLWHIREFFSEFPAGWKYYQKYMWLFSSRIITISNAVRDQFEPRFRNKCTTIYDGLGSEATGVDLARARGFRSSVGDPEFLVGVVGRIKWVRKGQEVLIKAAALLADEYPEARYVIVGSPSPGNEDHLLRLRELITNKNLEDRVIFTGDVQETRDIYAAFDVTVVPSILPEPFGCVVTESMAAGTPVIGSRCGGIPEQIEDGVTGLLFNPGDEEDLANALAQLLADKTKRLQMSAAGREHFRACFRLDDAHQHFIEIFRGVR